MSTSKNQLFKELLTSYLELNEDVVALIVSDHEGFIVSGEKKRSVDMELVSVLTALINPILERIRGEFAFKRFGSSSFDTEQFRLLFISIDENTTLSIVLDILASIDRISPYAFFLAEKVAQIIDAEEGEAVQITIPNFEIESDASGDSGRIKEQVYQMRLDTGGQYKFKFVIIGDHEVGKTSLIRRFVDNKFSLDYRATLGLNIMGKSIEFYGNQIDFSLWDVGAQIYFKRFRKTYYRGVQAAFIVYDITNSQSFINVLKWYDELETSLGDKQIPIVIVGNKSDLLDQRVMSYEDGVKLTNDLSKDQFEGGISYIETSAMTGENVEDAFNLIAFHYIKRIKELEEEQLNQDLMDLINEILEKNQKFTVSFITENPYWSPGLQILNEINTFCECEKIHDDVEKRIYEYSNGLLVKNFLFEDINVSKSDCTFIIFDARSRDTIDPKWRDVLIEIIRQLEENTVALIGIRVSESLNWSQLMEDFNLNEFLEEKLIPLLFFKIGLEYRLEIYDQLQLMFNTFKDML